MTCERTSGWTLADTHGVALFIADEEVADFIAELDELFVEDADDREVLRVRDLCLTRGELEDAVWRLEMSC